ncbi:dihydroorotase family protein [Halococcus sp. IIIV-5B]|uniref:dihydroorotase n=1 Tax=Halococcus sp. IIIV-5B TaxID=2321230 RepID=UPI000E7171ED|nr:amidohydrolase family protein [Halococcus sp. IIIV-5B]RJT03376.1 allantoinase [Halococcus sp. IIIV-5B]
MVVDRCITGGTVVTAEGRTETGIAIDEGRIAAVGDPENLPEAAETVDATGQLVMPGAVDVHVHVDDMFSVDSYETATSAAAAGGTTTYVDFAWQAWAGDLSIWDEPGTLLDGVERKREKGADALIDYGLHGAITREDPAVFDELADVIDAGVSSFKMFTTYEHGLSNGFMHRAMEHIADEGAVGVFHTEDDSLVDHLNAQFKAEGKGDPEWYPKSRPDYVEAMAADDAVRMALETGLQYYGIHTSCRAAADVIDSYQVDGSQIRTETCTHYCTLDDSIFAELGNLPMIAPPIRKPDDIEAMFEYIKSGTIGVVSTDHCGYRLDQKEVEHWWDSAFGANALQVSLPVFYDEAVNRRGLDPELVVEVMATNPARTFGLTQKGTLEPGTDADIVLLDPEETYAIDPANNHSISEFSIYEGREVQGRVKKTFVRGELVADDGEIVCEPGHGEFVAREVPDWGPAGHTRTAE